MHRRIPLFLFLTVFVAALGFGQDSTFEEIVNRAQSAYNDANLEESAELYQQAISMDPENAALYYNLGNVYYDMGSFGEAIAAYENSIERGAEDLRVYYNLGNAYYEAENFDAALAGYRDAREAGSGEGPDGQLTVNTAKTLLQLERSEEARELLENAVEERPENGRAWFYLGNIAYDQGAYEEAASHFTQATEASPQLLQAHFNLGNAFYRLREYRQAADAFLRVVEADPENRDAVYNLGLSYIALAESLGEEEE